MIQAVEMIRAQTSAPATDPAAEASQTLVLGALLARSIEVYPMVLHYGITRECFERPDHMCLFDVINEAMKRDGPGAVNFAILVERGDLAEAEDEARRCVTLAEEGPPDLEPHFRRVQAERLRRDSLIDLLEARSSIESADAEDLPAAVQEASQRFHDAVRVRSAPSEIDPESVGCYLDSPPPDLDPVFVDHFDMGDKVLLCASSKSRKSFFLIQLALHLAAGRCLLGFEASKPRRILFVNLEIKAAHFRRRVYRMGRRLGITSSDLQGRLHVVNVRGQPGFCISSIRSAAEQVRAEVIVIDPVYKLIEGDENSAADVKPLLAYFDQVCEQTGACVIYSHHERKGRAGDRDAIDRGAGSGVVARDYDAAIYLAEHAHRENGFVLTTIARNYAPRPPRTIVWEDGAFVTSDEAPVELTSRNARSSRGTAAPDEQALAAVLDGGPYGRDELLGLLRGLGCTRDGARSVMDSLQTRGLAEKWREPVSGGRVLYGRPDDISAARERYQSSGEGVDV